MPGCCWNWLGKCQNFLYFKYIIWCVDAIDTARNERSITKVHLFKSCSLLKMNLLEKNNQEICTGITTKIMCFRRIQQRAHALAGNSGQVKNAHVILDQSLQRIFWWQVVVEPWLMYVSRMWMSSETCLLTFLKDYRKKSSEILRIFRLDN